LPAGKPWWWKQRRGYTFGQPDLFIAAIAALEDLVVVTRDTDEFVAAGVPAFDPWSSILHAYDKATPIIAPASAEAVAEVILGIQRGR
jgi:toxin FitB